MPVAFRAHANRPHQRKRKPEFSMSFFADLRAERLIAEIRGIGDPLHPESQKAMQKLAKLGPGAIPKILDALAVADRKEAASYVDILTQLIDNKSFPILVQGMA